MLLALASTALAGCAATQQWVSQVDNKTISPLQLVLKAQPELKSELNNIEIRQVFNATESPTAARVVIVQTGLLDDSVRAIRSTYRFKYHNQQWQQIDQLKEYQCARGQKVKGFQKQLCS